MRATRQLPGWARRLLVLLVFMPGWASAETADAPVTSAPSPAAVEESIDRGVAYLLEAQNKNGSWGSAQRTKDLNIFAPVPGAHHAFRAAVTAMGVSALIETGAAETNPEARAALERAEAWLLEHLPNLRRADPTAIYNVWGHIYGLQALVRMSRRAADASRKDRIHQVILSQIDLLQRYEAVDGGWGYYDFDVGAKQPASKTTSFVSAAGLVALYEVKQIGIDVPEKIVRRAIGSINRQRKKDNSYDYGEYLRFQPMRPINRPAGSLGRSQACNLALRLWGDKTITDEVLFTWLDRLGARNGWLSIGRKRPIPHESWFQVAGYFFYFGHYYAALCIEQLDGKTASRYQDLLAGLLLPLQEKDGSWWDFPFYDYHQPYGTAFALMSLARCRKP